MGLVPRFWDVAEYRENLLAPLEATTMEMERRGVCVDRARLSDIALRAGVELSIDLDLLNEWAGREVNWNSWQQLGAFLHTDPRGLGLEPSPYWKMGEVEPGTIKTDDRALQWLAAQYPDHRRPLTILRRSRQWTRTLNYATDWLSRAVQHPDGTWRLHPQYGMASDNDNRPGARTGRFAVKNPALNQVPKPGEGPMGSLRDAFVAPPGKRLVVVDYSQLEIVILAHLCCVLFGGGALADLVRSGGDVHGPVARRAFGELGGDAWVAAQPIPEFKVHPRLKLLRFLAKSVIYGYNYGKQTFGTSVFLPNGEVLGEERAGLLTGGLVAQFPEIPGFQEFVRTWITEHRAITSLFGRVCPLPGACAARRGDRNRAWRQGVNYPAQAAGQEIMALALLSTGGLAEYGYEPAMPVHDEIVGWADEDRAEDCLPRKIDIMTGAVSLRVPLQCEGRTGTTWAEAK